MMTPDQIISQELPEALLRWMESQAVIPTYLKQIQCEFQQAQLDAIHRFIDALYVQAAASDALDSGDALLEAIDSLKTQLNDKAKR